MLQKIALKTGTSLITFLDGVIKESVKSVLQRKTLQEKEKQSSISSPKDATENSDDDSTDLFSDKDFNNNSAVNKNSKTMDDETEKLKQGNVESSDVIDKLNAIRAGKSFKDQNIAAAMDEYVNSLSKAEKTALLAFVKGIAQIATGEVSAKQAMEPEGNPADVEMKKGEKQKLKHVEPNVIKSLASKTKPKVGSEDTSGPVPITPKKK